MGKFLRSAWSTVSGIVLVALSTVPLGDVVHMVKDGSILGIIGAAIGGALIGANGQPKTVDKAR